MKRSRLHHPELGAPSVDRWQRAKSALCVLGAGLAGGVVLTVTGLLVHQIAEGEAWEVQEVVVAGNVRVSDTAVRHLADIRRGTHLFQVDLQHAVDAVQQNVWVRSAEARRVVPGTVEIVVHEHEPAMLVALDRLWYADRRGMPFAPAKTDDLDYPVVTGIDQRLAEARPDLARAITLGALRILDTVDGDPRLGPDQVSELRFDDRFGFTMVLRSGTEIILGFDAPDDRLDRLDRMVAQGLDLERPHRVDLDIDTVAIATPLPDVGAAELSLGSPRID